MIQTAAIDRPPFLFALVKNPGKISRAKKRLVNDVT